MLFSKRSVNFRRIAAAAASVLIVAMFCLVCLYYEGGRTGEVSASDTKNVQTERKSSDVRRPAGRVRYTAEEYADILIEDMTLSEKVGQLILLRRPSRDALALQKKYQLGGYLLFGDDFRGNSRSKLKKQIRSYNKKSKIPMLIAVDEEGGTVVRASLYKNFRSSGFKSPRDVYASKGFNGITSYTAAKDKFLKSLGINTNLAPVADVTYSRNDFMYYRAFSNSADKTERFIKLTVKRMNRDNVVSTLKHFPGYGGNGDTHGRIIRDKRSLKSFRERDLKPFAAGINAGADMVMVSHTIVNAFDRKKPASLSPKVHKYLRNRMHFGGVIISDGLGMKGVLDFVGGDTGEAAVRSIASGSDMVCVDSDIGSTFKKLRKAVKSGRISRKQLNRSVRRILVMKIRRGMISLPYRPADRNDIDAYTDTATGSGNRSK